MANRPGQVARALTNAKVERHAERAPARILVVDDEELVRLSVSRILQKVGYEVITAADGSESLAMMSTGRRVDLVLMDVAMPVMDGPTAVRELRARGVGAPIVLMSGYAEEELANRGMMVNANAFLRKPFEVTELVGAVRTHLAQLV